MRLLGKLIQLLFLNHCLLLLRLVARFVLQSLFELCVPVKEVLQHKFYDNVEEEFADHRLLKVNGLKDGKDKVLDYGESEDLKVLLEDFSLFFIFPFLLGWIF